MEINIYFLLDKVKNIANVTLLTLMILSIYSQYVVSDPFERIGPTMVFSFMLIGRLVIYYQVSELEVLHFGLIVRSVGRSGLNYSRL